MTGTEKQGVSTVVVDNPACCSNSNCYCGYYSLLCGQKEEDRSGKYEE